MDPQNNSQVTSFEFFDVLFSVSYLIHPFIHPFLFQLILFFKEGALIKLVNMGKEILRGEKEYKMWRNSVKKKNNLKSAQEIFGPPSFYHFDQTHNRQTTKCHNYVGWSIAKTMFFWKILVLNFKKYISKHERKY